MKNKILFLIFMLLIGLNSVYAKSFENLTSKEYEKVSRHFTSDELEILPHSIVVSILEEDVVEFKKMVIATTTVREVGKMPKIVDSEIVAETYNSDIILDSRCNMIDNYNVECTTDYKYIVLMVGGSGNNKIFHLYNQWIQMPKYKSFDLLGIRWTGGFTKTTQSGNQYTNGNSGDITYLSGNGNFKIGTNGVGLSQNLVDSATQIENEMIVRGTCSSGGTVYASYQHAQANITLATSKKYNFSTSGMAGVFGFYDGVGSYYDNTPGLEIHYTC